MQLRWTKVYVSTETHVASVGSCRSCLEDFAIFLSCRLSARFDLIVHLSKMSAPFQVFSRYLNCTCGRNYVGTLGTPIYCKCGECAILISTGEFISLVKTIKDLAVTLSSAKSDDRSKKGPRLEVPTQNPQQELAGFKDDAINAEEQVKHLQAHLTTLRLELEQLSTENQELQRLNEDILASAHNEHERYEQTQKENKCFREETLRVKTEHTPSQGIESKLTQENDDLRPWTEVARRRATVWSNQYRTEGQGLETSGLFKPTTKITERHSAGFGSSLTTTTSSDVYLGGFIPSRKSGKGFRVRAGKQY